MVSEHERHLIESLQQDDQSALQTIFLTYHVALCRIGFKITGDADTARDMVHDVYLKLWQSRKNLSIQVSLEFYLKRAVVNTCLNFLERSKKLASFEYSESDPRTSANLVEQSHHAQELSAKIDQAIAALPPRTRAVFTLIRFEEMSYREVAESLNISLKAVEKEMMKALNLLRMALKDYLMLFFLLVLS
ncbi:MAG TPA: RNA polymerase sigma-70 factor [Ohtaekwangia sp.]